MEARREGQGQSEREGEREREMNPLLRNPASCPSRSGYELFDF